MENTKVARPPIVTVLGHVDHGKTSLLDAIRNTRLVDKEVGGITQRIGAYTVTTKDGHKLTFIDTPGHETFKGMRTRGAKVADVVILVVAANEGVKPQTRESIELIKSSSVSPVVAITKSDLPSANPDQVKKELVGEGLNLEGAGGDIPVVVISSKTGDGVADLLEVVALLGQMKGLVYDLAALPEGFVIESGVDPTKGVVATIVLKNGKVQVGDSINVEGAVGKVRLITNEQGVPQSILLPGFAAQVLGFATIPVVGGKVFGGDTKHEIGIAAATAQKTPEKDIINIILKAQTSGALEAVIQAMPEGVSILDGGVGEVSQSDVMLASSFNTPIICFGVKTNPSVLDLARDEGVILKSFSLIYELLDFLREMTVAPSVLESNQQVIGKGEIVAQFEFGRAGKIAGIKVLEGRIGKNDRIIVKRNQEIVAQTHVSSIKQKDKNIARIEKGQECGIIFRGKVDFKIGDVVESVK